jgi:hypothetical protein
LCGKYLKGIPPKRWPGMTYRPLLQLVIYPVLKNILFFFKGGDYHSSDKPGNHFDLSRGLRQSSSMAIIVL